VAGIAVLQAMDGMVREVMNGERGRHANSSAWAAQRVFKARKKARIRHHTF
jgi:hypothetical protein